MKNIFIAIGALLVVAVIAYFLITSEKDDSTYNKTEVPALNTETGESSDVATTTQPESSVDTPTSATPEKETVIGKSAGGSDITAYHFGSGEKELLLVLGIHGGYSWNTALLGYEIIDWLNEEEDSLPDGVKVTVIPVVNPDGLMTTFGSTDRTVLTKVPSNLSSSLRTNGRFNANNVDLNRNFDCEWKATGTWQQQEVSGGESAFSEPEAIAIQKYVNGAEPAAVIAWYSAAGGVYASRCGTKTSPLTNSVVDTYASASNYKAYQDFDSYEITGDMVNWVASLNTPAISVLLTNHTDTEFEKNKRGIEAVAKLLAE